MPTYDYRCNACNHLFEHFQSISSPLLRKCPKCGKPKLERLIGAGAGFVFKGSGFYITDYRSKDYHDAAKKEQAPAAPDGNVKGESKGATKSDAKGDAKPVAKSADKSDAAPKAPPPASSPSPRAKKR